MADILSSDYKEAINEYIKVLRGGRRLSSEQRYEICNVLLSAMSIQYDIENGNREQGFDAQTEMTKQCITTVIPTIEKNLLDMSIDNNLRVKWYALYEKAYCFSARRSFKHFLVAIEWRANRKIWEKRLEIFEPIIFFLNKMALDTSVGLIRISMPPRIW